MSVSFFPTNSVLDVDLSIFLSVETIDLFTFTIPYAEVNGLFYVIPQMWCQNIFDFKKWLCYNQVSMVWPPWQEALVSHCIVINWHLKWADIAGEIYLFMKMKRYGVNVRDRRKKEQFTKKSILQNHMRVLTTFEITKNYVIHNHSCEVKCK